jgi:hypothetical protein
MSFDARPPSPLPAEPPPHSAYVSGPPAPAAPVAAPSATPAVLGLVLVGAAVSVALGVFGRLHTPKGVSVNVAGFSGPLEVKVWLATLAATLAVVQLVSALVMYGKLPVRSPSWIGRLHRWSGRVAFLAAIPVAMHCLYALGFQSYDTRVVVHSLAGCLFFGAFTVKMLSLSRHGLPGWVLPTFGGIVFTALTGLWLTSSLWFFTTVGVRF